VKIHVVLYGEDAKIFGVLKAFTNAERAQEYERSYNYRSASQHYERCAEGLPALPLRQASIVTTELFDGDIEDGLEFDKLSFQLSKVAVLLQLGHEFCGNHKYPVAMESKDDIHWNCPQCRRETIVLRHWDIADDGKG